MAWQTRLSVVCLSSVTCVHLLRRFNFSGIFLHRSVAWPSGNSPTKNHEDHPRGSPPTRGLNRKGVVKQANSHVWLSHLLMSFLLLLSYIVISSCVATVSTAELLCYVVPEMFVLVLTGFQDSSAKNFAITMCTR